MRYLRLNASLDESDYALGKPFVIYNNEKIKARFLDGELNTNLPHFTFKKAGQDGTYVKYGEAISTAKTEFDYKESTGVNADSIQDMIDSIMDEGDTSKSYGFAFTPAQAEELALDLIIPDDAYWEGNTLVIGENISQYISGGSGSTSGSTSGYTSGSTSGSTSGGSISTSDIDCWIKYWTTDGEIATIIPNIPHVNKKAWDEKNFIVGFNSNDLGTASIFSGLSNVYKVSVSSNNIGQALSENKSLKTVVFEEGITAIPDFAFNNSWYIQDLSLPSTLVTIGEYAFNGISSTVDITIPDSVTYIGPFAFYMNKATGITISSSISEMGYLAFGYAYNVQSLKFKSSVPPTIQATFQKLPTTAKIYVPAGSLSAYTSAAYYPSSSSYTYIEY